MLDGKRVLVTGGTGSLGQALLLRAKEEGWNTEFVIFSRDETKQGKVKSKYPDYEYILGDVAKYRDIYRAMRRKIDVVFHFAAYKQVPSAQNNVFATIETNIIGSQNVVEAALNCGVEKAVASSTDKGCAPINLYGVSKSAMESIFQNGNQEHATEFHLARYGNVICSNASVIPLFQRQALAEQPLTITHEKMTRFWLSIDTAIDLVLFALTQPPGTIVVPKAKAMSIVDVAKAIAPHLPHKIIGIRPGEKIHEAMVNEAESFHTIEFDDHFLIYPPQQGALHNTPFEYTSDKAERMTMKEMLGIIGTYAARFSDS